MPEPTPTTPTPRHRTILGWLALLSIPAWIGVLLLGRIATRAYDEQIDQRPFTAVEGLIRHQPETDTWTPLGASGNRRKPWTNPAIETELDTHDGCVIYAISATASAHPAPTQQLIPGIQTPLFERLTTLHQTGAISAFRFTRAPGATTDRATVTVDDPDLVTLTRVLIDNAETFTATVLDPDGQTLTLVTPPDHWTTVHTAYLADRASRSEPDATITHSDNTETAEFTLDVPTTVPAGLGIARTILALAGFLGLASLTALFTLGAKDATSASRRTRPA